jgi:hypothetical protein
VAPGELPILFFSDVSDRALKGAAGAGSPTLPVASFLISVSLKTDG